MKPSPSVLPGSAQTFCRKQIVRDNSERERQHEGRQPKDGAGDGGDGRLLFILRPLVHGLPEAIPYFDGNHQYDNRCDENSPNGYGIGTHNQSCKGQCDRQAVNLFQRQIWCAMLDAILL